MILKLIGRNPLNITFYDACARIIAKEKDITESEAKQILKMPKKKNCLYGVKFKDDVLKKLSVNNNVTQYYGKVSQVKAKKKSGSIKSGTGHQKKAKKRHTTQKKSKKTHSSTARNETTKRKKNSKYQTSTPRNLQVCQHFFHFYFFFCFTRIL